LTPAADILTSQPATAIPTPNFVKRPCNIINVKRQYNQFIVNNNNKWSK